MSTVSNIKKSELVMERMYFDKIEYYRNASASAIEYAFNFTRKIEQTDESNYNVSLQCDLSDKDEENIKMSIQIVGEFICECDDEETKRNLIYQNSIAILFPFLRSQISLVTTQPDILPIVLPTVNIISMFPETDK